MKFDMTKGKKAVYVVGCFRDMMYDLFYFHYYDDAEEMFEAEIDRGYWERLNIYDLKRNIIHRTFYREGAEA